MMSKILRPLNRPISKAIELILDGCSDVSKVAVFKDMNIRDRVVTVFFDVEFENGKTISGTVPCTEMELADAKVEIIAHRFMEVAQQIVNLRKR